MNSCITNPRASAPARQPSSATRRLTLILAALVGLETVGLAAGFSATEDAVFIRVATSNYVIRIEKKGFRYSFSRPSGEVIAPAHASSGLEFAGSDAAETVLHDANAQRVLLEVVNATGDRADVEIHPSEHYVKFAAEKWGGLWGARVA